MDGKSFSPSRRLNSGLVSYSQAVRIKLAILNTLLSIPSSSFFACSFFSGMITTASPSSFNSIKNSQLICCGENPTAIRSGQTRLSYFIANFCTSSGASLKLMTLPTPLLAQFLTPFLTTSSRTSQSVIVLASVHFPRATPASPTPAFTTSTSLFLNRSLSRMTYLATMTSMSHNRSPSSSCGNMSRSEILAFILKPQCRMMSRLRSLRISLGEEAPCDSPPPLPLPAWFPITQQQTTEIHQEKPQGPKDQ